MILNLIKINFNSEFRIEYYMTDESIQFYDKIKDKVDCPVCLDLPIDPVYCQECSGTVCRKCLSDSDDNNCVLCRQATIFRPSRKTISFLDLLKFKCRFEELGCKVESV